MDNSVCTLKIRLKFSSSVDKDGIFDFYRTSALIFKKVTYCFINP